MINDIKLCSLLSRYLDKERKYINFIIIRIITFIEMLEKLETMNFWKSVHNLGRQSSRIWTPNFPDSHSCDPMY